jgi:hypothetical protein
MNHLSRVSAFGLHVLSFRSSSFMNPKLLSDVKVTNSPLTMITNAGEKKKFFKGKINGFGDAWYDPDQVANIFGFSGLEDQCRITYDSSVEKAFNVHTNDGSVKFKRNADGLYVYVYLYQPSKDYLNDVAIRVLNQRLQKRYSAGDEW